MAKDALTVRSQLIPLDGMRLVLPNTSIAEVITQQAVEASEYNNAPLWVIGQLQWRGIKIPLLSFEQIADDNLVGDIEDFTATKSIRIVVLNASSHSDTLPFYAIVAQGIPRLMALNDSAIIDAPEQSHTPYILRNTLIDANPAIIPNMQQIESELFSANIHARELV